VNSTEVFLEAVITLGSGSALRLLDAWEAEKTTSGKIRIRNPVRPPVSSWRWTWPTL